MDISDAKVGLDIDGTVAGFTLQVINWANKLGLPFYDHYTQWQSWMPEDPLYQETFNKVMSEAEGSEAFFYNIPPLPKAHVSFDVQRYVSARKAVPESITDDWVRHSRFPDAPVHVVGSTQAKIEKLSRSDLDVYVDDKPETYARIKATALNGWDMPKPVLVSRPPNIDDFSDVPESERIQYLSQLPTLIQKI
jgi:hypothetical protein